ncbi:MAG: hypothetical protein GXP31_03735 [Kiritimatiellaeota bacterium]|nr:hypothetical protein [Kiritimatiellota bacterium]
MSRSWRIGRLACMAFLSAGSVLGVPAAFLQMREAGRKTPGGRIVEQHIQMDSESASFGMVYDITLSNDMPEGRCRSRQWVFQIGFVPLGMPQPVLCNWYSQGFFTVRLDGENLYDRPLEFRAIRDGGADALLQGRWTTEKGPVFVRLLLRGADDKLLMQVWLPPENRGKKLELELLAYPQGFSKPRRRRMVTPVREVAGPAPKVELDPETEPWALFYDAGMAGTTRAMGGPCGMVYAPAQARVRVDVGPYSVQPVLVAQPGSRRITVGIWDFSADPDLEACRAYLKTAGAKIAADVAEIADKDWVAQPLPPARLPEMRLRRVREMQKRRRQPTPYDTMTDTVRSPHVPFARPLAGGPISALIVAPRWGQRETVELGQRLDLRADTVSFSKSDAVLDGRWLYLYGSYDLYGYARKTTVSVLGELRTKLQRPHNVIVLSNFKAGIVPTSVRAEIATKVRAGTGLLLIGGSAARFLDDVQKELKAATWAPEAVAVAGLPVFREKIAPKQVLWTAYTLGKGRVLVFNFGVGGSHGRHCLTPRLPADAPDARFLYDLYHSFVAKGMMWAARRTPPVRVTFARGPVRVVFETRQSVKQAVIESSVFDPSRQYSRSRILRRDLPAGRSEIEISRPLFGPGDGPRFVLLSVRAPAETPGAAGPVLGWGATSVDAPAPVRSIRVLRLDRTAAAPGDVLRIHVELSRPVSTKNRATVQVRDARDRLLFLGAIAAGAGAGDFTVPLERSITPLHRVVCEVLDDKGTALIDRRVIEFTVRTPIDLEDVHFLVWTDGANDPMGHLILEQLAANGVDWIDNVGLTQADARQAQVWCRNAALYGLRSIPYITRISCETPAGRVRRPCLTDPGHLEPWLRGLRQRARAAAPYAPAAYTLGDENYLVRPKHDVCTSPTCLAGFRAFLQREYGDYRSLNKAWKTNYTGFDAAVPATFPEVKDAPSLWPRWADHRRFMDTVFTRAHVLARQAIREVDPGARVGWDGVFSLDSWHGYDYYQLCRQCDLNQVYASRLHQIEYVRSWHRPGSVRGAWYNTIGNRSETAAKALGWHLLFHDFNSLWYWMAYSTGPALLFPDMRPTPQFEWMAENARELRGGIGKALLHARRLDDGIAVYYSQASVHAGTLMGRTHAKAQWGFMRAVEDLGLQYRLLSYAQVTGAGLAGIKVLFLPFCAALSPEERAAIRRFVENGGLVVADSAPGVLDQHCRVLDAAPLDALFGVRRKGLAKAGAATLEFVGGGLHGVSPLVVADTGIVAAGAEAWARAGETPCVLVHRAGKGRTVLLNTAAEQFEELHMNGASESVRPLMERVLALAGVTPPVRVVRKRDGQSVGICEVVRFRDRGIEYVCILRDHRVAGVKTERVVIGLPQEAEVVDVRAAKSLGRRASVETDLVPGDPKIYALLPEAVTGLRVTPIGGGESPAKFGPVRFRVRIEGTSDRLAGPHVLHVEAFVRRNGKDVRVPWYSRNILTQTPATEFTVPFALSDRGRTWRVRVRDVTVGRTAWSTPVVLR